MQLIRSQDKSEVFRQRVDGLKKSGAKQSLVILTHAMIELPWIPSLFPMSRSDKRMPKIYVSEALDDLIVSTELHRLSVTYYRSILSDDEISASAAEERLIDWIIANLENLHWDGNRFNLE